MVHSKPFWIGLILALCCLLLLVISTSISGQAAASPVQTPLASVMPSSSSFGLPAIRPSLPAGTSARFTIADVKAYLRTHPFFGGPTIQGATKSIVTIQFMTSQQASTLMQGETTGLSANATVCYVKLHGPFTLAGAPVPSGAKQLPDVADGVEIFDAQTGNLLMWWVPSV